MFGLDVFSKTDFEVEKGFTKKDVSKKFVGLYTEGNILTQENYQKSVDYCKVKNL